MPDDSNRNSSTSTVTYDNEFLSSESFKQWIQQERTYAVYPNVASDTTDAREVDKVAEWFEKEIDAYLEWYMRNPF